MTLARAPKGATWHVMLDAKTALCGLPLPAKRLPPVGERIPLAAMCSRCKRLRER